MTIAPRMSVKNSLRHPIRPRLGSLASIQRLLAFDLDRAEVDEHVLLRLRANRTVAEAVLCVKPLHRSQFHGSPCLDATHQTSPSPPMPGQYGSSRP